MTSCSCLSPVPRDGRTPCQYGCQDDNVYMSLQGLKQTSAQSDAMNTKCITALTCCLVLAFLQSGFAWMSPVPKHRVGTPPGEVIKTILQTNLNPAHPPKLANLGVRNKAPQITWLADSDPALSPEAILPSGTRSIYSVRNIANQLTTVAGSVDYGVLILHTPVLLISATSTSDTIMSLLKQPEELPESTKQELHHLFTPFKTLITAQTKNPLPLALQQKLLIEQNIDYQVELAIKRYKERIRAGRLVVVGSVLDTNNTYRHGPNRLIIININGKTSERQLKRSRVLKNIPQALLRTMGREIPKQP